MRTREEIEQWLDSHLPDGPETTRQEAIQDALNWVMGLTGGLDPG